MLAICLISFQQGKKYIYTFHIISLWFVVFMSVVVIVWGSVGMFVV